MNGWPYIFIIAVLTIVIIVLIDHFVNKKDKYTSPSNKTEETDCDGQSSESCGSCTEDCILFNKVTKPIEYFDDEELDAYKGKTGDQYTEEETEIFRNIFETLKENEVRDWVNSLQQRSIELPDSLKDEIFLILNDRT